MFLAKVAKKHGASSVNVPDTGRPKKLTSELQAHLKKIIQDPPSDYFEGYGYRWTGWKLAEYMDHFETVSISERTARDWLRRLREDE